MPTKKANPSNKQLPKTTPTDKTAERVATGLLTFFLIGFGWSILLTGGVSLSGKRGVSYIDGNGALMVAGGTFLFAALCSLLFSHTMGFGRQRRALLIALVLLPPAVVLLLSIFVISQI